MSSCCSYILVSFAMLAAGCANGADAVVIIEASDGGDGGTQTPDEDGGGHLDASPTDARPVDATPSGDTGGGVCADWAAPTVSAKCTDSCSKHACGPNGCYGNWWCEISTGTCKQSPPAGCN